jgi:putative SOS response-associated peptidase YedK
MRGDLHYTLTSAGRFNISPGQDAPACVTTDKSHAIQSLRFGLLPRWKGHGGKRGPLVHAAPLEAVAGTPLLRDSFKKQRCLVLADGCFAWRELKQPIWFHPEPRHVIAFAGVWNTSDDDGIASFALLLGPPLATRVNDAMPIVIAARDYDAWLDPKVPPDRAAETCMSPAVNDWRADAVSTRMSSAQYDDERCIAPVGNPNQRELF